MLLGANAEAELIRMTPLGVADTSQVVLDPVPIGADGFRLTYHGNNTGDPILNPVLLIFATPDGATPGLTFSSSDPALTTGITLGGTNVYGGTWNPLTGAAGTYDQTDANKSVYEAIGLTPPGSPSESYTNWTGASGLTSWSLFVYQVTFNPLIDHGDWVQFSTTNLAAGSFVVGYGCTALNPDVTPDRCNNSSSTESTPFTFAGMVSPPTKVPEPATLTLFGVGLAAFGFVGRKRRQHAASRD